MRVLIALSLALGLSSFSSLSTAQSAQPESGRVGTFKQVEGEAWIRPSRLPTHCVVG